MGNVNSGELTVPSPNSSVPLANQPMSLRLAFSSSFDGDREPKEGRL